jgi:hypothetical protein
MGRNQVAHFISAGPAMVFAAAACVAGALLPPVFAAVLVGVLLVAGVIALTIRRADHALDAIFREELSAPREASPKKKA